MARRKRTIIQRDMRLMEVREEMLGRGDLELRGLSLRGGRNMRPLATGAIEQRPGLVHMNSANITASNLLEFQVSDGETVGVYIADDELAAFDENGGLVHVENSPPWSDASEVWNVPLRGILLLGGSFGIYKLLKEDGAWEFSPWEFAEGTGGRLSQPYWAFKPDTTIQPSARTGQIVITASEAVFNSNHAGLRIRYLNEEILVTEYLSPTSVRGEVVNILPPSYQLKVDSTEGFKVGEIVVGVDSNYQAVITDIIDDTNMNVATLNVFKGPNNFPGNEEQISGPSTSTSMKPSTQGSKPEISPQPVEIWDEPMMSDARGWPRSAGVGHQRLFFVNFPDIPAGIAGSSVRGFDDFDVGATDDDAIVREIGDSKARLLHVINAGDLVILSDRGSYIVPLRDQSLLTPSTFSAVLFDDRGSSVIPPVRVNDGIVFVESNNASVAVAMLDGNVQLRWRVQELTEFHNHLINNPVSLSGPAIEFSEPEKYVFVINADGTVAALSYNQIPTQQTVGVAPWDTEGSFISIAPIFGEYWAIVERETSAGTVRFLEKFSQSMLVDCGTDTSAPSNSAESLLVNGSPLLVNGEELEVTGPDMEYLPGKSVYIVEGTYVHGPYTVNSDGTITDVPDIIGTRQVGLNFTSEAQVWPVDVYESARHGTFDTRCIRFLIETQNTGEFQVRCNNDTRTIGGYEFGDILGSPPPLRSKEYAVPVFGRRTTPDLAVIKHKPGRLRILSLGQEVQF